MVAAAALAAHEADQVDGRGRAERNGEEPERRSLLKQFMIIQTPLYSFVAFLSFNVHRYLRSPCELFAVCK